MTLPSTRGRCPVARSKSPRSASASARRVASSIVARKARTGSVTSSILGDGGGDGLLLGTHPRVVRRVGILFRAARRDGLGSQLEMPALVRIDLAQPVRGAVEREPVGRVEVSD